MASGRQRSRQFTSTNSGVLKSRGVTGLDVTVRLEGSTLHLRGGESGQVAIPASSVDLIRQFRMEAVQSLHAPTPEMWETKIWWDGGSRPVLLMPIANQPAYRDIIAEFAGQVAAAHGLKRLRIGPGYLTASINLLLVGIPVLILFAYVFWIALTDGGWWWLAAAVIFMAFSWLAGRNLVSRWPRSVRSLDQFVAELR
jgi:hypothetical protein